MSLSDTKAWATREYETASHSRAILSLVNGDNKKSLRRVYLFDYPIYHLASRMDRERQLFNATMAEHIQHEQRRSPWLRRTLLSILFAVIFWVLYAFPPPIVAESALYRLLGMWRREAVGVGTFALAGYKVHVKVPEKVWVDATDSSSGDAVSWSPSFRPSSGGRIWRGRCKCSGNARTWVRAR
jgi:hypothetical protein